MKVNRRYFRTCPPSFPKNYDRKKTNEGWTYQSMFFSVQSPEGMYLRGLNEWGDYMGDMIYMFAEDIEKLLTEKPDIRKSVRRLAVRPTRIRTNRNLLSALSSSSDGP